MAVDWLGFGYAALVTSGGLIGYAKAGSVPSLAAGLLFGSFAGLGAYQLSQDPNNVWISLITSGTLTAVMGTRFYNSGKFMPAGLIAGVRSNKCTQEEKVFGRRIREVSLILIASCLSGSL
ncbi:transmembrane protein 14C-like isoform X1 [Apteryx mantelli]|uniref:Transmembrane protein 14C n=1 Tax=Apteryx mantelli TaxID=2696672 RepID=A0A8B7IH55_9AVES|nr:PREDICTED: transmembrane protein 14C-like isoform X1 [Apteryx mantelli mantelli]XP_025920071.1 transmembrane protein 14C-like isoform X1 [Apteryx rowi]XP_025920072.1 transmembrane protein 14C-like isoform X1 [Apteryx rowi]